MLVDILTRMKMFDTPSSPIDSLSDLVIVFPDLNGSSGISFGARLRELYPEARIVPILNGSDRGVLERAEISLRALGYDPIVVSGQGLFAALLEGYDIVSRRYPDSMIVRIDTEEHPLEKISALAKRAEEIGGFVVGDLEFDGSTLIEGTLDWDAHMRIFPELYSHATNGKLPLSCAHGFQAFAPGVLSIEILAEARVVLNEVIRRLGYMPRYGLDGLMAICCSRKFPVERILIPAITLRNRTLEKINEQIAVHTALCEASLKIFV